MLRQLKIEKLDERGINYSLFKNYTLCKKVKGSVSGNHSDNVHEEIYFLNGKVELTIDNESIQITEPTYVYIEPKRYRKVTALTDAQFLVRKW